MGRTGMSLPDAQDHLRRLAEFMGVPVADLTSLVLDGMTTGPQPPLDLADTVAEVARVLLAETELGPLLSRMSILAVATIDGARHCGITLVEGERVHTAAASDEVPERVDRIQYEVGQGPCLDAIRDHQIFETGDLVGEARWPAFATRAAEETQIRSMLSFRLFAAEDTMGSLNLYSDRLDAFDEGDRHVGAVFAAHAAVALSNATEVANLRQAVKTRDVIGVAKGMLMARGDLTDDQAFEILRRASQRTNVKLREVAERIVARQPMPGQG